MAQDRHPMRYSPISQTKLREYQKRLEQTQEIARLLGMQCSSVVAQDEAYITLRGKGLLVADSVTGPWFQGMVEDASVLDFQSSMETGEPELLIRFTFDLSAEPDTRHAPHLQ